MFPQIPLFLLLLTSISHALPPLSKPNCKPTCGTLTIPFPFGIGPGCFLDPWFEIHCNRSTEPVLSKLNLRVIELNLTGSTLVVALPPSDSCKNKPGFDLSQSPYGFSSRANVFAMEGCPGSAALIGMGNRTVAGCATVCGMSGTGRVCFGVGCCQMEVMGERDFAVYRVEFNGGGRGRCLAAGLVRGDSVQQYVGKMGEMDSVVPVVMGWRWVSEIPPEKNLNANCSREGSRNGTVCECKSGYYGNPYLSGGCQVHEECVRCRGYCQGKWDSSGHLVSGSYSCEKRASKSFSAILGLGIGFGIVLLALVLCRLFYFVRTRREMRKKSNFFKRNGGFLLQQQLSSNEGFVEKTKIFSIDELEKATDYFNENRILGQGGQGTVYKGMLTDGRIVAIKKSLQLDESQLEQFINEVAILSQINHKHVVKLLGCCLETEVPLLVYEFIANGTLSQHIHDPEEDSVISWKMRLKIAADSASAIAYLHSSSSVPVYHRDIKSSNILLDEKNSAKVSDFGSSKTIAIDQTHLTTLVQGTMGYLDPEYFQSYKFTEKSDVYSFGVVLLELLTGKKPIYRSTSTEQMNLVTEFLYLLKNSHFSHILDPRIVEEATQEELKAVVELTKRCLCWRGRSRPTMKEVAMGLEMIIKSPSQASTWDEQDLCDGFSDIEMFDMSDTSDFVSTPLPNTVAGSLRIDVHPLLPNTV